MQLRLLSELISNLTVIVNHSRPFTLVEITVVSVHTSDSKGAAHLSDSFQIYVCATICLSEFLQYE